MFERGDRILHRNQFYRCTLIVKRNLSLKQICRGIFKRIILGIWICNYLQKAGIFRSNQFMGSRKLINNKRICSPVILANFSIRIDCFFPVPV